MRLQSFPLFLYTALQQLSLTYSFSPSNLRQKHLGLTFVESKDDSLTILNMAGEKIGIFFGTSTGSTEEAAYLIAEEFGSNVAAGPFEIDEVVGSVASVFNSYDALIVGTPTWNTGADTERSGTGWDEVYYGEMEDLDIAGKKVAVFGLGDQISYSENYADASGELHDVFEKLGCNLLGYVSQEGYEHEASKAARGDKFCGLLLDAVNQEEMTAERVKKWVAQLKEEGILEGNTSGITSDNAVDQQISSPDVNENVQISDPFQVIAKLEKEKSELLRRLEEKELEENSKLFEDNLNDEGNEKNLYTPHHNPKTGRTMWTSLDGKSSYFTNNVP
jgi:flavodoxin I